MTSKRTSPAANGAWQDISKRQIDDPALAEIAPAAQAAPPTQADLDAVLDDLKFDLLVETADLTLHHAERVREAALGNDRDRAHLHACQASRCLKTMLLTIAELNLGRRR